MALTVRFASDTGDDASMGAEHRSEAKPFSTGSLGWNASGKVVIDGKRYQVSCNLIEVDSATDETRATAQAQKAAKAAKAVATRG